MWREYPRTAPWQRSQEQQRSFMPPPVPAPPPGMGWPPPVANDRTNFGGIVISLFLVALFFILQGISAFVDSHLPLLPRLGALLFFYLLPGISIALGIKAHKQSRRWDVVNQRRHLAAALGFTPDVPLAQPQPVPNLGALPLHTTIKLKINWFSTLTWACLAVCSFLLFWMWLFLFPNLMASSTFQEALEHVQHFFSFSPYPYIWPIYALPALVNFWNFSRSQRIEVTPEGLSVKHPGYDWFRSGQAAKQQMIWWQEARLFAIRGGKPGASSVRYELSGPFTVVTFERILRPRWWSRFRPGQSFGEYNMQMDALLALISAHTGLLLYDVRQHE